MLIQTNDKAVQDIQAGNLKESLGILERMEKILEVICSFTLLNFPSTLLLIKKSSIGTWLSFVCIILLAIIKRISLVSKFNSSIGCGC